jgi:hypothetical protein
MYVDHSIFRSLNRLIDTFRMKWLLETARRDRAANRVQYHLMDAYMMWWVSFFFFCSFSSFILFQLHLPDT